MDLDEKLAGGISALKKKVISFAQERQGRTGNLKLSVCMMGPRAVGKTTVMTSLFSESVKSICGTKLYMTAERETANLLFPNKRKIECAFDNKDEFVSPIAATGDESKFNFSIGIAGNTTDSIDFEVCDFPGEYLTSDDSSKREKVKRYMRESQIVLIAVDTPCLMELNGKYNLQQNNIPVVTDYILSCQEEIKDKMLLIVPLKSELYFHNNNIEYVADVVTKEFWYLVEFCKSNNTACYITPIQTLGGVVFDKFETKQFHGVNCEIAKYRFTQKAKYEPMFCSQPLYYVLQYMANYYEWLLKQPDNGFASRIWSGFESYMKNDKEFFMEINRLSKFIVMNKMGFRTLCVNNIIKFR